MVINRTILSQVNRLERSRHSSLVGGAKVQINRLTPLLAPMKVGTLRYKRVKHASKPRKTREIGIKFTHLIMNLEVIKKRKTFVYVDTRVTPIPIMASNRSVALKKQKK